MPFFRIRRPDVKGGLGLLLAAVLLWGALVAPAQAANGRVALVMGNAAYRDQPLRNPVNDARAMARTLRELGFDVMEVLDADKRRMETAVLEFGKKLSPQGVGLFFYAGHGLQVKGRNYLVPVDARIDSEAATRVVSVDVELLLEQMADARNGANVVILDACRNNPFERRLRGSSQGLAAIDAARGTLVAYATAPGAVAADGEGTHGLYTDELLKALRVPGLKIEEVFKRVRVEVSRRSNGAQTPWESSSLTGDLVVNVTVQAAPAAAVPATADRDALFWATIKDSRDRADFEAYLKQFPDGTFADLARRRLAASASASTSPPVPAPVAAAAASAPQASAATAAASRFDGPWQVVVTCTTVDGKALGYELRFKGAVSGGQFWAEHGKPDESPWLSLSGPIGSDGAATLQARGRTGPPGFAIGKPRPGSPYQYRVQAQFDERTGRGRRLELRPCELVFERL